MRPFLAVTLSLLMVACNSTENSRTMPPGTMAQPSLEGPLWVAEDIGGQGIIDNSRATIEFQPDGRLNGRASCNGYFGSYSRDGMTLAFSHMGATKMACPPALMEQEDRFLALLSQVTGYAFATDGALLLKTPDGQQIRFHAETKPDQPD